MIIDMYSSSTMYLNIRFFGFELLGLRAARAFRRHGLGLLRIQNFISKCTGGFQAGFHRTLQELYNV